MGCNESKTSHLEAPPKQEEAVAIHSALLEDLLTYPVLHRSSLMPSSRVEEEVFSTMSPLQLLSGNGTGILLLENAHD